MSIPKRLRADLERLLAEVHDAIASNQQIARECRTQDVETGMRASVRVRALEPIERRLRGIVGGLHG